MSTGIADHVAAAVAVDVVPPTNEKTPAPAGAALIGESFRGRAALAALGLAAAVAISAGVAAVVASAIVAGSREERVASTPSFAAPQGVRRLEEPVAQASAPTGAAGNGTAAAAATAADGGLCLDTADGEMCHRLVIWAMEDGARFYPERYAGLSLNSSLHEVQLAVHLQHPDLCPRPCGATRPKDPPAAEKGLVVEVAGAGGLSCDYGHGDSKPAHAGCFVTRGGKLLVEKLTYGGNKYDIPGGQSNWREPARCTAHRETYEETGYLAAPRELLAVVRGGFHIYRCELIRQEPVKGHDHEISWVGWMDAGDISRKLNEHSFRFPEAHRYAGWIR